MYVRIITRQLQAGRTEEFVQVWQDHFKPFLKQQTGLKGAYLFGDRSTDKLFSVAFWESEAEMMAAAANVESRGLPHLVTQYAATPPTSHEYEVFGEV
jgi:heme-degrading monooxygenase HmoA